MRRFLYLILVIVLTTATACAEGLGLDTSVQGNYGLVTVNGRQLPYSIQGTTSTQIIRSGTLQMHSNGDFVEVIVSDEVSSGRTSTTTDRFTGSYETDARGRVYFLYDNDDTRRSIEGEYDSNTLTMYTEGFTVVYRR